MKSKSAQFTSDNLNQGPYKVATDASVGPGSYAPVKDKKGGNDTLADMSGEHGSSSFESDMRRKLPW